MGDFKTLFDLLNYLRGRGNPTRISWAGPGSRLVVHFGRASSETFNVEPFADKAELFGPVFQRQFPKAKRSFPAASEALSRKPCNQK